MRKARLRVPQVMAFVRMFRHLRTIRIVLMRLNVSAIKGGEGVD
jgi:hypothetical protein